MNKPDFTKETCTVGGDDPVASILIGHVDQKTFTKAFIGEGWDIEEDDLMDIKHEYGIMTENKKGIRWKWGISKETKGAQPITISYW